MPSTRIVLSGLWVALMLTYLLGDVLRIYAGDFKPGEIFGRQPTQAIWLGIAGLMLVPIVMVVLTLTLPHPAIRWTNIVVAALPAVFQCLRPSVSRGVRQLLDRGEPRLQWVDDLYAWKWVG